MNLVGLMPCRNEDWVLELSARVALMWCDELILFNHASNDCTTAICSELVQEYMGRVRVIWEPEPTWDEMSHRQRMLDWARANDHAATHIAIIDADEILTANLLDSIREHVAALSLGQMLTLPLYNLRGGLNRYHLNGVWGQRTVDVAFKDVNTAGWRGNKHHARAPEGVQWQRQAMRHVKQGHGGVMHLWGASERRLVAKHALYKIRDTLRWPDQKTKWEREYSWAIKGDTQPPYQHFGTPETWTYADVPVSWFPSVMKRNIIPGLFQSLLDPDAEPWQEAEVRRLVAEHGRERFEGLDLFGIA